MFPLLFLFITSLGANSRNMELISTLNYDEVSDLTGFEKDGREFAVVGLVQDAASFVDITDPYNPFENERIDENFLRRNGIMPGTSSNTCKTSIGIL